MINKMKEYMFLWLYLGFLVILAISAVIADLANWANWGAYLLTAILYAIVLFFFLKVVSD